MLRVSASLAKTAVLLLLLGLQAEANNGDGYHGESSGDFGEEPANYHRQLS
jgi:hypothetical protein